MTDDKEPSIERRLVILNQVYDERDSQIDKGYTLEHDLEHGIQHILSELGFRLTRSFRDDSFTREDLIKDAALLVSAIEVMDTIEQRSKEFNHG